MKIVFGGYMIGFPVGGLTWHHLNYVLGLVQLGHEVVFLEDSGEYGYPWDPENWQNGSDSSYGRRYITSTFERHGIGHVPWCYYSQFEDKHYGLTRDELHDALRDADLLICLSGVTPMRPERPRPRRTCVIDTDPVFTQLKMLGDAAIRDYYLSFDAIATFGKLIGTPACELPTFGREWIPHNQAIALDHWPVTPNESRAFTTLGKWEHTAERHLEFRGKQYLSSKGVEWAKLLDLPARTEWELHMAMSKTPADVQKQFEDKGWVFEDAWAASTTTEANRAFVQQHAGELTVAKQIYAGLPTGWFSDRSACFLASGRPVITQSSGFEQWLPTGEGLFSFATIDEAAAALADIASDYSRHAAAARKIAEAHFDAGKVLPDLLAAVG